MTPRAGSLNQVIIDVNVDPAHWQVIFGTTATKLGKIGSPSARALIAGEEGDVAG